MICQKGFVICSKNILLKKIFVVVGAYSVLLKIQWRTKEMHKTTKCVMTIPNLQTRKQAWKSLTYTQSHTDGNKAETQMWFFSTPCLIWKNKSKVQILAQFLIFFLRELSYVKYFSLHGLYWSISIYMDNIHGVYCISKDIINIGFRSNIGM